MATQYEYTPSSDNLVTYRQPSDNSNGNFLDNDGKTLLTCEHANRVLSKTDLTSGERTVIASEFGGSPLTSPNDVVVSHRDGSIWFTDPDYGALMPALGHGKPGEQAGNYVYRLDPKTGAMWPVATDFVSSNLSICT